jgi:hypothetical protein
MARRRHSTGVVRRRATAKVATDEHWLDKMVPAALKTSYGGEPLGIETQRGAALRIILLRDELLKFHGSDTTRLFAQYTYTKPASKKELTELRDWELLERFDAMPKPNISQFACALAEENKKLPREQQRGVGGVSPVALDRYIRRLLHHRQEAMQNHQWDGPTPPK